MSRVPALRLLLPLIAGVLLGACLNGTTALATAIALAMGAAVGWGALHAFSRTPSSRQRVRPFFIIPIALAAAAVGLLDAELQRPVEIDPTAWHDGIVTARVERLTSTEASMKLHVKVLTRQDSNGAIQEVPPLLLRLTTRGCDHSLRAGDLLSFKARLRRITPMGNPDETDFAALLARRGLLYEQHLPVGDLVKTGRCPTWLNRCDNARQWLESKVLATRLSPEAQAFVIATLLGNSEFIDTDTRQSFSRAGVAHVLALSGLHVAIVMGIFWFFLFPLDYLRQRKLRLVLTLVLLAAYTLLTGASPSVVRAALMAAAAMCALVLQRRAVPLNALCVAAMVIVVASPLSIFATGFQMSFLTVGALLLLSDKIREHAPSRRWVAAPYYLVATSTVALLTTLPLTAYYFHTVSWGGIIANLLVVPLLPVMLVVCATFLFLAACGTQFDALNAIIDAAYHTLERWTGLVGDWTPGGSAVYASATTVWCYYGVALALIAWLFTRRRAWGWLAAAVAVVWAGYGVYQSATTPRTGFVVFNDYDATPTLYFEHGTGYLWMPLDDDPSQLDDFKRRHAAFLAHHGIDSVGLVNDTVPLRLEHAAFDGRSALLDTTTFTLFGPGKWKRSERRGDSRVDVAVLTRRFHGTITTLTGLYDMGQVVLSGDIYEPTRDSLTAECRAAGLPLHDLGRDGAIVHYIP